MHVVGAPVRIRRYYFVSQPVRPPTLPNRWRDRFDIRVLTEPGPELTKLPLSQDVIAFRYAQRAVCFFVTKAGEAAGCLWLCLDDYTEDEVAAVYRPIPEEATAWDFDAYVSPRHRGSLIFSALWDTANVWLADRGVQWSVSRISAYNLSSLAAHKRLGARIVGAATFIRIGRAQLCCSNLGPRFRITLKPSEAPLIHVPAHPIVDTEKQDKAEIKR
jgi:hypothetical protein